MAGALICASKHVTKGEPSGFASEYTKIRFEDRGILTRAGFVSFILLFDGAPFVRERPSIVVVNHDAPGIG